jgi:predicted nucleic acid-binding protein
MDSRGPQIGMSFVVDASVAGGWFLPDEATATITELARCIAEAGAAAPDILWHEVCNLLINARRRGLLPLPDLEAQLDALDALPLRDAGRGETRLVARLARHYNLTSYDAAYLAVAMTNELPLASLDKELRTAAKAEGVAVLPKKV